MYARIKNGVVVFLMEADPAGVFGPQAAAEFVPAPEGVEDGWLWDGEDFSAPPPPPEPSQFERDEARYRKRAAVKDALLAYMAADNMSRVRSGTWTVADLTALLADPAVAAANQFMSTLSFELAAQAIASASTPLLTPAIRADWIARLQAHFYMEG